MLDTELITNLTGAVEGVTITAPFKLDGALLKGSIRFDVEGASLEFVVEILPFYPFQFHEQESIRFINQNLLEYNHVNADGSICVHTLHSSEVSDKIRFDFEALRQWIIRYYINKATDMHYEHIIVPSNMEGSDSIFLFTEINHTFTKDEFGVFRHIRLSEGHFREKNIQTNLVVGFEIFKQLKPCSWHASYQNIVPYGKGIFVFIEHAPVVNGRFAISSWNQLEPYVSQKFLSFLYETGNRIKNAHKNKPTIIPLLIGYRLGSGEVHWQAIHIHLNNLPNYGEKLPGEGYVGKLKEDAIDWAQTRNCSYSYFFGRGVLHKRFTQSKILIIGVGAIGSMIATSLTRGGCTQLYLLDHDLKEPENVCRSEYIFASGLSGKVQDLQLQLTRISPFVQVNISDGLSDALKFAAQDPGMRDACEKLLEPYDLIIDCSTDYDMAYILDKLTIKAEVINLSITNHSNELVCAVKPNMYAWLIDIFKRLPQDLTDLYNPTGCWSPTFKASYTDIAVLVQYAIKHINLCFEQNKPLRNFHLATESSDGFTIKLNQY